MARRHIAFYEQLETQLRVPQALAMAEEYLLETMPKEKAEDFLSHFLSSIPLGADLSLVAAKFMYAILDDAVSQSWVKRDKPVAEVMQEVMTLFRRSFDGCEPTREEWQEASSRAFKVEREATNKHSRRAAWCACVSAQRSMRSAMWCAKSAVSGPQKAPAAGELSRTLLDLLSTRAS